MEFKHRSLPNFKSFNITNLHITMSTTDLFQSFSLVKAITKSFQDKLLRSSGLNAQLN